MCRITAISRANKIRLNKRRGAALYALVLIICILMASMSAVAIQMFGRTARIERWQADRLADINLETIARSAAESASELFIADGLPYGTNIDSAISSDTHNIEGTSLTIGVIGASSADFTVTAAVSNDKSHMSIAVRNTISGDQYISAWSPPKWSVSK